jgi:hypothetical protein
VENKRDREYHEGRRREEEKKRGRRRSRGEGEDWWKRSIENTMGEEE